MPTVTDKRYFNYKDKDGVVHRVLFASSIDIIYIDEENDIKLSDRMEQILWKDNTEEYVPTLDYHPSTKKYVDDSIEDLNTALKKYVDDKIISVENDITEIQSNITQLQTDLEDYVDTEIQTLDTSLKEYIDDKLEDLDQYLTVSIKKKSMLIGDGQTQLFTLQHNLNSTDIIFKLRHVETQEYIIPNWRISDNNTIQLKFRNAPQNNEYEGIIYSFNFSEEVGG